MWQYCLEGCYGLNRHLDCLELVSNNPNIKGLQSNCNIYKKLISNDIVVINGYRTYSIEQICQFKIIRFLKDKRIVDLYDLAFIYTKYKNQLSELSQIEWILEDEENLAFLMYLQGEDLVLYLSPLDN